MSLSRKIERIVTVSNQWEYRRLQPNEELALFAAGCFWGVESLLRKQYRRYSSFKAQAVYTGDPDFSHPTYDRLGDHIEAVLIKFDPTEIPYAQIVLFFFQIHDPTEKNGQGNDQGRQYRSRIWTFSEQQATDARKTRDKINLHYQKKVNGRICSTKILPAVQESIWIAERYHQDYITKHPDGYHCESHYVRDHIK